MSLHHSPPPLLTFSSEPNIPAAAAEEYPISSNVNTRKRKTPDNDLSQEMKLLLVELEKNQDKRFNKLNLAIEANSRQNTELLAQNTNLEKLMLEYKNECIELKKKVITLESACADSQSKINKLEDQIEEMQRFQKRNMVEIRKAPKEDDENLQKIVSTLMETLNLESTTDAIKEIYRRGKDNAPIIMELSDSQLKPKILNAVRAYNKDNPENKLSSEQLGIKSKTTPIYISELLTTKSKALLHAAKQVATQGGYKYCWSTNGKILLRKDVGLPAQRITTFEQLEQLKLANLKN